MKVINPKVSSQPDKTLGEALVEALAEMAAEEYVRRRYRSLSRASDETQICEPMPATARKADGKPKKLASSRPRPCS